MPDQDRPDHSSGRRRILFFVKLGVSVALLTFLFWQVDTRSLLASARQASLFWLAIALSIYTVNMLAGTWRWELLLNAQNIQLGRRTLFGSYLVAAFFNNFLPSNIGGDVIRIRDTAEPAGSKTLATTVVLVDRVLGLMGLVLVAALGATMASRGAGSPIWPVWLWAGFVLGALALTPAVVTPTGVGRLLKPLTIVHPEWVGERIETLISALTRFREQPGALARCFTGAVFVQFTMVVFYLAVVYALHMPLSLWDLAVIVPISFVVQMLPLSVNGFGVREAAFSFYFTRLHLPIQSAILLSLMATALMMLFSLSGAAVYVSRSRA